MIRTSSLCPNKHQKSAVIPALSSYGGADRDRTDYLLTASQALSQVSYNPSEFIIDAGKLSVNHNIFCPTLRATSHNRIMPLSRSKTAILSQNTVKITDSCVMIVLWKGEYQCASHMILFQFYFSLLYYQGYICSISKHCSKFRSRYWTPWRELIANKSIIVLS